MEKISRRSALAMTGAAALGSTAAHAMTTSELDALIEAHQHAEARWIAALDAEGEWDDAMGGMAPKVSVPLTIGGEQSVSVHYSLEKASTDLRDAIAKRYQTEAQRIPAALRSVSPDLSEQVIAALRKAQANDLRTLRRMIREESARWEASGYAAMTREYEAANDAEDEALHAILAYRCTSLSELAKKVRYVLKVNKDCQMDNVHVDVLLSSMLDEEVMS